MAHTIVAEKLEHAASIEAVLGRAFGPGRFAKTSERVRERGARHELALSRVALNGEDMVIGVCRIYAAYAGAPLFFLGPLAVDPKAQEAGVGLALVHACVAACRAGGGSAIVLVGAERFFRPAGFTLAAADRLVMPGPFDAARFLWLELRPGGLDKLSGEIGAPRR